MSSFKWVIYEATEDVASTSQGGRVDLQAAKVVTIPHWLVQPPDGTVALVPQPSGEVELAERPRQLSSIISPTVLNFALVFLVVVIGFVLILDTWRGNVTFEKFLYVLAPLIAGFTAGSLKRTR